jgi:hypothetical protein
VHVLWICSLSTLKPTLPGGSGLREHHTRLN